MRELTALGHIEKGVLKIHQKERFRRMISEFGDTRVMVIVKKLYKQRSNEENKYYWGCIIEYARQCINNAWGRDISKEMAHDILVINCNYEEVHNEDGQILRLPLETHNLSTVDYEKFLEKCRQWIYEYFEVHVPLPNEQSDIFETEKIAVNRQNVT
jgi:hypothetical protein